MAPVEDLEKALAEGGKIDVQKKSGDWSSFTVGSLGKPFDVDGVQMCYGYAPGDEDTGGQGGGSSGQGGQQRSRGGSSGDQGGSWDRNQGSTMDAPVDAYPGRDPSEPMPEYQGGPEDEWAEF